MSAPSITTNVYKYRRYAPWMLGVYAILLVSLFIFSSSLPSVTVNIAVAIMILIPVYGALRPKSFFSVRSIDERKLAMDSETITWDGVAIPVKDVAKLSIYLFAFDNFKHRTRWIGVRQTTTEYGDQNKLNFVFQEKEYDFTFYLGNYTHYRAVLQIIDAWKKAGVRVSARTAFDESYIKRWNAYYSR